MGKQTRNFRQTNRPVFSNVNQKQNPWHMRVLNYLKVKGTKNG